MKLNDWVKSATDKLTSANIATARLDCMVILEDITAKDSSQLLAHPETLLQGATLEQLDQMVERRVCHEPLAYIRGKTEFYGRECIWNAPTFEPGPETETMIVLLKQVVEDGRWKVEDDTAVIDTGTGSGCIGITAKLELPYLNVLATDLSNECLVVAKQNAKKHSANVKFYRGNLLEALPSPIFPFESEPEGSSLRVEDHLPFSKFAILANLPYVPDSHTINQAAMFEPPIAIFGGPDGLDLYRQLFSQINDLPKKPQFVLTESLPTQHKSLEIIADHCNYKLQKSEDFIQVFSLRERLLAWAFG